MREEAGLLDDVADGAAEVLRVILLGGFSGDEDFAGSGEREGVDHAEEGGFAAAAAAKDGGGGAGIEGEVDVVEEGAGWLAGTRGQRVAHAGEAEGDGGHDSG